MARIFDNIDQDLLSALRASLQVSMRSDFCVGYLNLRGWQSIDDLIESWDPGSGQICRVLVGMQRPPHEEIRELYRAASDDGLIDNATALRLKTQFAAHLSCLYFRGNCGDRILYFLFRLIVGRPSVK